MTTDFQEARAALGMRLREIRESCPEGRLTGVQLATRLGWAQSKVSRLENGRQTATAEDLRRWAEATGCPEATAELHARLHGLESHVRSWRRQLAAGHRAVQDAHNDVQAQSTSLRAWEPAWVVGVLQTPDYARAILTGFADLHQSGRDVEDAVRSRMRRQEGLYDSRKRYRVLLGESALHALVCPPSVLAAQLDRLAGVIGLDTVELGIVPLGAPLKIPAAGGFWIYDERQVVVETWHAELWIDDAASIAVYSKVWSTLSASAVYGADAHAVIGRARRALDGH
ncbi:helix-turn-helix domain-containing protein [Streptomyces chryseus]|uniref:helix-turn-helix domain-containing protein n=1 Tax=Streptomyces chryseus TaxID=68186 RepID=UPI00110FBF75|nr:helix-turn-helix transcriptional regulator [Streptomyces chryseus]GGX32042.1 transcriptional regulator [Streptomyces chryseus]